jgi:hypothetical protein
MQLTDQQRTNSAALLWILKGNAAQRAITAWHFGWQPAQAAAGSEWLAPFLAQTLNDPYGVVRYISARSLRSLPGFESFQFDFLGAESERIAKQNLVIQQWRTRRKAGGAVRTGTLLDSEGNFMEPAVHAFISERDDRSVTIKE